MPTPNEALAAAVAPVADAIAATIPAAVAGRQSWYAVNRKAETPDEAEVLIYDEIGAWGVDAKAFAQDIRAITAGTINVRLNTPGGSVFDGTAIHNSIRSHPARIIMHVEGVAASAGSFIMLAGDEIRMADNAYVMIHNSAGGVMGGADDMRGYAELLEKIDGNIAMMYSAKTGKPPEHYRGLMDAETWFTAAEAKAEGLVDTVYTAKPAKAAARAASCTQFYNKIPDGVRRMWGLTPTQPAPEDSQRSEPPPATPTETTLMSDSNKAAPAPTPAAPSNGNDSQENKAPTQDQQLAALRTMTSAGYVEQGRKVGVEQGKLEERDRLVAIVAACPGKPQLAIDTFTRGQNAEVAKLAYDAEARADARTREVEKAKDLEIQRLSALLAIGGSTGVAMSLAGVEDDAPAMDPKAKAEWEWENKPEVRKTARTKDIYVIARTAELDGTHRSFQRATAN